MNNSIISLAPIFLYLQLSTIKTKFQQSHLYGYLNYWCSAENATRIKNVFQNAM
jgi:hypothetical protein